MTDLTSEQIANAKRFGAPAMPPDPSLKVGIARNVLSGLQPLNALRHPPVGDTSGWYIWAGEDLSDDPDYFVPLHISLLAMRMSGSMRGCSDSP
jgi:hypothetical protein